MNNIRIVPMTADHLDALEQLERTCFSRPWSRKMLAEELDNQCAAFLVAEDAATGQVIGYAGLLVAADEGYITNIAVAESCRRQGLGRAMLGALIDHCRESGASFLTLEVRQSNAPAIALYESMGFLPEGRRKNFYRQPTEDAILMTKRDLSL